MKTYKHLDVRAVSAERSELKEKAAQWNRCQKSSLSA